MLRKLRKRASECMCAVAWTRTTDSVSCMPTPRSRCSKVRLKTRLSRVGYYRDCLRAESFTAARLRASDPGHLLIAARVSGPFHGGLELPPAPGRDRWLQARRHTGDEPLTVGWPLVQGVERAIGGAVEQFSPLLVGSARLAEKADRVDLESAEVELDPVALELLGFAATEADALIAELRKSIDVDETVTLRGRIAAIFELLERASQAASAVWLRSRPEYDVDRPELSDDTDKEGPHVVCHNLEAEAAQGVFQER